MGLEEIVRSITTNDVSSNEETADAVDVVEKVADVETKTAPMRRHNTMKAFEEYLPNTRDLTNKASQGSKEETGAYLSQC